MADGDRSLTSGISFPQWMKTRMNDKLSFEQTAFSPPDNDDSFLYIRYNKLPGTINSSNSNGQSQPKIEVVPKTPSTVPESKDNVPPIDFSKHTVPCKKFMPNSINVLSEAAKPFSGKIKSSGTDDGFKGEAAQCGSSVIRVARQMVSGKLTRQIPSPQEEFATEPTGFNRGHRRGSKSLPSSPLTSPSSSPKARRRHMNKYFSGNVDTDRNQGGWILSGLLRRHELSRSVGVINEEEHNMQESLTKALSQISVEEPTEKKQKQKKPKTAELREMNFWSPTSL